jgi:hypothetical protein
MMDAHVCDTYGGAHDFLGKSPLVLLSRGQISDRWALGVSSRGVNILLWCVGGHGRAVSPSPTRHTPHTTNGEYLEGPEENKGNIKNTTAHE